MTGVEGLDRDLMVEVWRNVSRIVEERPWLLASWSEGSANIPHVVVHDGPLGAALHFDDQGGPYWSGGFTRRLTWAQVAARLEPEEWDAGWGEKDSGWREGRRSDAYALISALHSRWLFSTQNWDARPAAILGEGSRSVFDLDVLFPTVSGAVREYLKVIEREHESGEKTGRRAYWHEPFWLICSDGEPRLLIDEAGVAHVPVTTEHQGTRLPATPGLGIDEIVRRANAATDLAADGYSFELDDAFARLGGADELADLCERGAAAVIFALEWEDPAVEDDASYRGSLSTPIEDRDHWGWRYGTGDHVLDWLGRSKDADVLRAWHDREEVRRRRISALRTQLGTYAPFLVQEALADFFDDPQELTGGQLDSAMIRHLRAHMYPAVPISMVDPCLQAIELMKQGNADAHITLPVGVTYADQAGSPVGGAAPAREIVRQHSLSNFVALVDDYERAWDLPDALEAWDAAERGEWEIPSPSPTWPEYVTLLLVGRNHLVPGVEDDPSERDTLASWWDADADDWDRRHVESWWSEETARVMNLPERFSLRGLQLRDSGIDPRHSEWLDLIGDLANARRGHVLARTWSGKISAILGDVMDAGSIDASDLIDLERAFLATGRDLTTTVSVWRTTGADFADFADTVATSLNAVGMAYGQHPVEEFNIEHDRISLEEGYADFSLSYVDFAEERGGDMDYDSDARLELFRAGSRVLVNVTESIHADLAQEPDWRHSRWLPSIALSEVRYRRWTSTVSELCDWYTRMQGDLSGPLPVHERGSEFLADVRNETGRAIAFARLGQFADAEIVLEAAFEGWTEVSHELIGLQVSAQAELAALMGGSNDIDRKHRQLLEFLSRIHAGPAKLIEVAFRVLDLPMKDPERRAWIGFARRTIAFTDSWHPDAPTWRRQIVRLESAKPMSNAARLDWQPSALTPPWDGRVGAPSLVVVLASAVSQHASRPTAAHLALAHLERKLGDDMLTLAAGNDAPLRLAGLRRIIQLGRRGSPQQVNQLPPEVRGAVLQCQWFVGIGVSDIDGWTHAAQNSFAPDAEVRLFSQSEEHVLEAAVTSWVSEKLSAIAYGEAMRDEDEARRWLNKK